MSSLKERIELLENDLKAVPPRISVYHDLPFAILRYDPSRGVGTAAGGQAAGDPAGGGRARRSTRSPCRSSSGERSTRPRGWTRSSNWSGSQGYNAAQDQVTTYLSERDLETAGDDARRAAVEARPAHGASPS